MLLKNIAFRQAYKAYLRSIYKQIDILYMVSKKKKKPMSQNVHTKRSICVDSLFGKLTMSIRCSIVCKYEAGIVYCNRVNFDGSFSTQLIYCAIVYVHQTGRISSNNTLRAWAFFFGSFQNAKVPTFLRQEVLSSTKIIRGS